MWRLRGGPQGLSVCREGLFGALAQLGGSKEEVTVDLLPAPL